MIEKIFIVGGAGFIGSHFVDELLCLSSQFAHIFNTKKITIYDNFSSGRKWHYEHHLHSTNLLQVVEGEIEDTKLLEKSMMGHDLIIHLASNPDIAKAAAEPDIDFRQGTALTNNVLEAMRKTGAMRLLYASGSGVYGDLGEVEAYEDMGPLKPVSTYGASKLAGEALIGSYCAMFGMRACAFRFGNVVGGRATHGVGLDFTRKLLQNPKKLVIMGNGTQSKSYVHVSDIVRAVMMACCQMEKDGGYQVYNVATGDYITVREIADMVLKCLDLNQETTKLVFGEEARGWKGDVPIVRINTNRIKGLGWEHRMGSMPAMEKTLFSIIKDIKNKKYENE